MAAPVVYFPFLVTCDEIQKKVSTNANLNGFPVVNSSNKVIGMITKRTLLTLVEKKCFYDRQEVQTDYEQMTAKLTSLNAEQHEKLSFITKNHVEFDFLEFNNYPLHEEHKIHFYDINEDYLGRPKLLTPDLEQILKEHSDEFIDLRPFFTADIHFVYTNDRM